MEMNVINIVNDGEGIEKTNYFSSEWAKNGIMACSFNDGTFRMLIPDRMRRDVREMKTGKEVIISKGTYQGQIAYEFLFDDHTDTPYMQIVGANQMVGPQLADDEHGRAVMFSAWTKGPKKAFESPARFRVVEKLPCMKPWEE